MDLISDTRTHKMAGLAIILGVFVLLSACGGGVSEEDLEAVKGDLQTAQDELQRLQTEILKSAEVGFDQVSSLAELATARGSMSDRAATYDDANQDREWLIIGEWSLNCSKACAEAPIDQIDFGMAFSMFRAEVGEMGNSSHGHTFWGFEATGVKVLPGDGRETLELKGDITGSGGISTDGITITLEKKDNGHFTFSFQLDDGNVLRSQVGGVVLESKAS